MNNLGKRQGIFSLFNIKQVIFACMVLFCAMGAFGASYTWTGATSTAWNDAGNWTPNTDYPAGAGDTAIFNTGTPNVNLPASLTVGTITADVAVILSGSSTLTATIINGAGSVTGTSVALSLDTSTVSVDGGIEVASVNAIGTATLSTNITTSGTQTYGGAVTLRGDVSLSSVDDIEFQGTIDSDTDSSSGNYSLETMLTSAGSITLTGAVGLIKPLESITLNGTPGATITIHNDINTLDYQGYFLPVTLSGSGDISFTSSYEDIAFGNTLGGTRNVTVSTNTGSGLYEVRFRNNVTVDRLSVNATNISVYGDRTIKTTGDQIYTGLFGKVENSSGSVTLEADAGSSITFNGDVQGVAGGELKGTITDFSVTAGTINTGSSTTSITTTGNQTYEGTVISKGGVNFYSDGDIRFSTASGNSLQGSWINIVADGNVELNGSIDTGSSLRVTASGSDGIQINTATITTSGEQVYTSLVTLVDDIIMDSDKHISFSGNITGAHSLTTEVPAGERIIFGGYITYDSSEPPNEELIYSSDPSEINIDSLQAGVAGGTSNIHLNADITTTGGQTYNGAVTLGGDTALIAHSGSAGQDITFDSTITGSSHSLTIGNTTSYAGTVRFPANITVNALTVVAQNTEFTKTTAQTVTTTSVASITGNMQTATDLKFSDGLDHVLGKVDTTNYHDITLNGDLTATTGSLSLQGNLLLADGKSITLSANSSGANITLYGSVNNQSGGPADTPVFNTPQLIIASSDNHEINIVNDVDNVFEFGGIFTKSDGSPESGTTTFTNGFRHTGSTATLVGTIVAGSGGLSFEGATSIAAVTNLSTITGNIVFSGAVTTTGDASITAGSAVAGNGNITFTDTSSLTTGGELTLSAADDRIELGCNITGSQTFTLTAATLAFLGNTFSGDDDLGQTIAVTSFNSFTGAVEINDATTKKTTFASGFTHATGGGDVRMQGYVHATTGGFNIDTNIILEGETWITDNETGNIDFGQVPTFSTNGNNYHLSASENTIWLGYDIDTDNLPETITCNYLSFWGQTTPTQTVDVAPASFNSSSIVSIGINTGDSRIVTFTQGLNTTKNASVRGTVNAGNNQSLIFGGTVSGGNNVVEFTAPGTGVVTFTGAVSGYASLTVDAATININGGSVTTTANDAVDNPDPTADIPYRSGNQTYNGNVVLGANTTFTINDDSTDDTDEVIEFNGAVSGTGGNRYDITVTEADKITFADDVTADALTLTAGLLNFEKASGAQTIDTSTSLSFEGTVTDNTAGPLTFSKGFMQTGLTTDSVSFAGTVIASEGNIDIAGNLILENNTTLQTQASAGEIRLGGNVNNGAVDGDVSSPAFTTENLVFSSEDVQQIDINGVFTFVGANILKTNAVETTISNGFSHTGSGNASLKGTLSGGASFSFSAPIILTGDTFIDANGTGDITFSDSVTGNSHDLKTKAATNAIRFNDDINDVDVFETDTNTTASSLTLEGSVSASSVNIQATNVHINGGRVTTIGAQEYTGNVTIANVDAEVSSSDSGAISVSGETTLTNSVTVSTAGTISFNTMNGPGALTVYGSTDSDNATSITFTGTVGGSPALASVSTRAGWTYINGSGVTTESNQIYYGAVSPGTSGSTVTLASNSGDITFSTTLGNSSSNVEINADSGTITFGGSVYTINSIDASAPIINMGAGTVSTVGAQTYTGAINLTNGVTFSTSSGDVVFTGVESFITGRHSLTVTDTDLASNNSVTFDSSIGVTLGSTGLSGEYLASMTATMNTINLNASTVGAATQEYNGNVVLDENITFYAPDGTVSFNEAITDTGTRSLTIQGAGSPIPQPQAVTFDGAVDIGSLNVTATTININGGSVLTTGAQTYTGAVNLDSTVSNTTNLRTTNSNVLFDGAGTVDGEDILDITAETGTVTFNGVVGTTALTSIDITATTININGGSISTDGAQSYTGVTTFNKPTTIGTNTADVTFTGTLNASTATQTLNVGTDSARIGVFEVTGAVGSNIGAFNIYASADISFESTLELDGTTIFNTNGGNVRFTDTVNGATRDLTVISSGTISFGAAISNFNNITANAGMNVIFNSNVNATGILSLSASTSTTEIVGVEFNGNVTAGTFSITNTSDAYIGSASAFTIGTSNINFPRHVYIMAGDSNAVSFNKPLIVGNSFLLRSGAVSLTDSLTTNTGDVVLLGSGYVYSYTNGGETIDYLLTYSLNANFTENQNFRAAASVTMRQTIPSLITDIDARVSISGTITNLAGKTINVGKNFYANGIDLNGTSSNNWTLRIPDNNSANAAFAEARNLDVSYCTVESKTAGGFAWVAAAGCAGTGVNTDVTQNTGWWFSRPQIRNNDYAVSKNTDLSGTYTVTDDIVRVEFQYGDGTPALIENTNNEISAAVSNIKLNTGVDYSAGFAFSGSFTNPEGTITTNGKGDLSVFYLRVSQNPANAEQRWNTDATGLDSGNDQSTDMGRSGVVPAHRETIPNVYIPIALNTVYETLRDQYKNRIATVNHTATADRASPVLAEVFTGQEVHESITEQKEYDAHNFIELRYSEPVTFGVTDLDTGTINIRSTSALGHIANDDTEIEVSGLLKASGSLTTGNKRDSSNGFVNALYRNFNFDGSDSTETQSHRLRVSIAGYVDGKVTVNGQSVNNYPGYIDEATSPSGIVTVLENINIKDISDAKNILDHANEFQPTVSTVASLITTEDALFSPWDTSPPSLAHVKWDGTSDYEILAVPNASGTSVDRFEFHFHDNTLSYSASTLTAERWVNGFGWGETVPRFLLDTVGGSRPDYTLPTENTATKGGLRTSSLVGATDAFTILETTTGIPVSDGTFEVGFLRYIFDTSFFSTGTQSLSASDDTLYLTMTPNSNILDPTLQYKIAYDTTTGFITDLAGNRLLAQQPSSANLVAPLITLTLAPFTESGQTQELFIYFNKAVDYDSGLPAHILLEDMHEEFGFYTSADETSKIADLHATAARIAFHTETSTGLILTLSRALKEDELFTINLRPGDDDENFAIFGENGAKVNSLGRFPVTYFGVNTVFPLNAISPLDFTIDTPLSTGDVSVINFDGSKGLYAHRDITMQVQVENGVAPLNDSSVLPKIHLDSNAEPITYTERYKEETGEDITFWMPSYSDPASVFSEFYNDKSLEFDPNETDGGLDRYTFTIGTDDIGRDSGYTMQFLFEMGRIKTSVDGVLSADANTPLYHINIPTITDLGQFSMFAFRVFEDTQRGGVTILNNVINSNEREETLVEVTMPQNGNLNVTVLTLDGDVVQVLSRGQKSQGNHYFTWNGTNNAGNAVARGMYFVRVVGPGLDETRKVMVVKE